MAHKDPEKRREYYNKWRQANADRDNARCREYYEKNKEVENKKHCEWQKQNRDKLSEYNRQRTKDRQELNYILGIETRKEEITRLAQEKKDQAELDYILGYIDKPDWLRLRPGVWQIRKQQAKERQRLRQKDPEAKAKRNTWKKNYLKTDKGRENRLKRKKERLDRDPVYKMRMTISKRIAMHFFLGGYTKYTRTCTILGISYEGFKQHLESQFEPWMNWSNYGKYECGTTQVGWDIDHIIPISTANSEQEVIMLNHYTNLQPLDSYINRHVKKDNIL